MSVVKGRVIGRRDWCDGLWSMFVDAPTAPHEPGQFLNIGLAIDGRPIRRAYSLASAPGAPLEFYLVRVAGGALTPVLHRLQPGDELDIDPRPHGFFVPSELPVARDLWLVASGTGLGPYMAMLREGGVLAKFERVLLVHGVRSFDHLGYKDELTELARSRPSFCYLPALSRDSQPDALHGRITTLLSQGGLERAAHVELNPSSSHVMLCGNPEMIVEMMVLLSERGLKKHRRREPGHITTEKYW
jgi:ferredoxin--NADP+ reductase